MTRNKRIVNTDNHGGDYPDEKFELFPMTEDQAKALVAIINDFAGPDSDRYWKVVDLGYKLQPGFEP